jgi:hypothetical protein
MTEAGAVVEEVEPAAPVGSLSAAAFNVVLKHAVPASFERQARDTALPLTGTSDTADFPAAAGVNPRFNAASNPISTEVMVANESLMETEWQTIWHLRRSSI